MAKQVAPAALLVVFRSKTTLAPLYEQLACHSVLTVKAETIATFLGRKIGSQFSTHIEGTCPMLV